MGFSFNFWSLAFLEYFLLSFLDSSTGCCHVQSRVQVRLQQLICKALVEGGPFSLRRLGVGRLTSSGLTEQVAQKKGLRQVALPVMKATGLPGLLASLGLVLEA